MAHSRANLASERLTPQLVLWAYRQGFFPMARGRNGAIDWYSPDPRAILPLDAVHVSRSLQRRLRRGDYVVSIDRAFSRVIRRCAEPRPYQGQTWINNQIIEVYTTLHEQGFAHSVEAWRGGTPGTAHEPECGELVGGIYGLAIGAAFFGESMFSSATDASKVTLVRLVEHLRAKGFTLMDTQMANPFTQQFGVIQVPRQRYLELLAAAIDRPARW